MRVFIVRAHLHPEEANLPLHKLTVANCRLSPKIIYGVRNFAKFEIATRLNLLGPFDRRVLISRAEREVVFERWLESMIYCGSNEICVDLA